MAKNDLPTEHQPTRVVVVSGDQVYGAVLGRYLESRGMRAAIHIVGGDDVLADAADLRTDVVVAEIHGLLSAEWAVVEAVRAARPLVEMVVISADPVVSDAVRAMRAGAFAVLGYPVSSDQLAETILLAGARKRRSEARLLELNGARYQHHGDSRC